MADKKYYVFCKNRCLYEAMTKEQTLAAIEQAVSTGEIKDVDTGFITKIKEQNKNVGLKLWVGTQAEYNAIETKQNNCFYIITNDTAQEDILTALESLQTQINTTNDRIDATVESLQAQIKTTVDQTKEAISAYFQAKINEINESINELGGRIDATNERVNEIDGSINSTRVQLQGQIENANETTHAYFQKQINEINESINELKRRIDAMN